MRYVYGRVDEERVSSFTISSIDRYIRNDPVDHRKTISESDNGYRLRLPLIRLPLEVEIRTFHVRGCHFGRQHNPLVRA